MSIKITNLTNRPIILTLSSGNTLHLAPRVTSSKLENVEIQNNPKIDKLLSQFVISVDDLTARDSSAKMVEQKGAEAEAPPAETSKPARKGRSRDQDSTPDNP